MNIDVEKLHWEMEVQGDLLWVTWNYDPKEIVEQRAPTADQDTYRDKPMGKKYRFPYTVHSAAPMATSNTGVGEHQKVELINIVKYRSCSFMFFSRRLGNFMYLNFFYSHETRVACL